MSEQQQNPEAGVVILAIVLLICAIFPPLATLLFFFGAYALFIHLFGDSAALEDKEPELPPPPKPWPTPKPLTEAELESLQRSREEARERNRLLDKDVEMLRRRLLSIEVQAANLPWAHERHWQVRGRIRREHGLPLVDLHDLNQHLAEEVVTKLLGCCKTINSRGIRIVTGHGRNSPDGFSVLQWMVERRLDQERGPGWRVQQPNEGAFDLLREE